MDKRMRMLQERIYDCTASNLESASTEELGEAIDMIKDLAEGIYYEQKAKLITKELEEKEKEPKEHHYYTERYIPYPYRDMDKEHGRMYYDGQPRDSRGRFTDRYYGGDEMNYYHERELPLEMRDSREGRSPTSRRMYMESKEMHKDKTQKIKDLEKYMKELTDDIVEMIEDASPEERQVLERKMSQLTSKVASLNTNA